MNKHSLRALGGLTLVAGLLQAPYLYAQGVGTGPLNASALPVSGALALAITVLGLIAIGYWALRKNSHLIVALTGPVLLAGVGLSLIASPDLRAALADFEFTNPAGQYIDASGLFSDGQAYFTFANASGVALKVTRVENPDLQDCEYNLGKPNIKSDVKPTQPRFESPISYPTCTEGEVLENGDVCELDFYSFCYEV